VIGAVEILTPKEGGDRRTVFVHRPQLQPNSTYMHLHIASLTLERLNKANKMRKIGAGCRKCRIRLHFPFPGLQTACTHSLRAPFNYAKRLSCTPLAFAFLLGNSASIPPLCERPSGTHSSPIYWVEPPSSLD